MKIKLLSEGAKVPKRADEGAAGYDLYTPSEVTIRPGRNIVPLDIAVALELGTEGHIRPRSGFSAKGFEGKGKKRYDADVIQGTIDPSYRGNVGVIVKSYEDAPFVVEAGTRIAQMVIEKYCDDQFEVVGELDQTERGDGGFGHSGTH